MKDVDRGILFPTPLISIKRGLSGQWQGGQTQQQDMALQKEPRSIQEVALDLLFSPRYGTGPLSLGWRCARLQPSPRAHCRNTLPLPTATRCCCLPTCRTALQQKKNLKKNILIKGRRWGRGGQGDEQGDGWCCGAETSVEKLYLNH